MILFNECENVGQLVDFLSTKDRNCGVVDMYGQVLKVQFNSEDSGEDIVFAPGDYAEDEV